MTDSERTALRGFEAHVRQLLESHRSLKEEVSSLQRTLSSKDDEIARLEMELSRSKRMYSNLKLARMMEFGDTDLKEGKSRITRLVREVNKCIRLLEASEDESSEELGIRNEKLGIKGEIESDDFWGFKQSSLFSEEPNGAVIQIKDDGKATTDTHTD